MLSDIFTYMDPSPPSVPEAGPLVGTSVAIQPNMSVRGWPTEAGSAALERFVALEDATVIDRLRASGATIRGSTHMSELGFGLAGETGHEALAQGQVDVVLMTDTMGEARVAASALGTFGFKPSYGIVSRFGLIGLVPSMECYGILAHRVEEIAAVMREIAGEDDRDFSMPAEEPLVFAPIGAAQEPIGPVGVIQECIDTLTSAETSAFQAALAGLRQAGMEIQMLGLEDVDLFRTVHQVIGSVEASSSAGKYDGVRYGHRTAAAKDWNEMYLRSRAESFGLPVKTYLFQGAYFQFENYPAFENACRIRARLVQEIEHLLDRVEVLAFPTRRSTFHAATASTVEDVYDALSLTLLVNVTGHPSVQVPGLVLDADSDLGLQLVGPRLSDARLLSMAAQLSDLAGGE